MCTGVEIALLAAMVVSAGSTVYSANQQANAAEEAGRVAAGQAGQTQDAAQAQADMIRQAARRQAAQAEAAFSGAGVDVGTGSPLKINEAITKGGELDALNAIISGGRGADALSAEAVAYGRQAVATRTAGALSATSTVLAGGAQAATASGWRSSGPGFSGTQSPAPISDRSIRVNR